MGSAEKQGPLWGAAANDWSELAEPGQIPFYEAAFDAIGVGNGTHLLDVGCGAGLAEGFLAVARGRVPSADLRLGDIEELPFDDAAFDAVTAFNSVQYATDPSGALREIRRVGKPSSLVAVVTWGTAEQCEMRVVLAAIGSLLPPSPPGAGGPFALAAPGALEALVEGAGLTAERSIDVPTPYIYDNLDDATRAQLSSGPARMAINTAGLDAATSAIREAMATGRQADGTIRLDNVFKVVVARA